MRFAGEAVAAIVAPSKSLAEDLAEQVGIDIAPLPAVITSEAALADGAALVHDQVATNTIVDGAITTPGFDAVWASAHAIISVDARSRRQECDADGGPRRPRRLRPRHRPASR